MKKILSFILAAAMIAAPLALSAAAADGSFRDVAADRWSAPSIAYAVDMGYMKGVGGGLFDPEGTMTRAMVVTVLWRMNGSPEPTRLSGFRDVPDSEWYAKPVAWAKRSGVVNGVSATHFDPDGSITREQMAAMLSRYTAFCDLRVEGDADLSAFPDDSSVSDWARESLSWAVGKGLITGSREGKKTLLLPGNSATREQFAAILERYDLKRPSFGYVLKYNLPVTGEPAKTERPLRDDADFFVSPTGNDGNPGAKDAPFATFERAREAVRAAKESGADGGIVVAFFEGNYGPLSIRFDPSDSGTEESPITYTAYGDGEVVFMNGVELRESDFAPIDESDYHLFPEKARGKIKKADVSGVLTPEIMKRAVVTLGDTTCAVAGYPDNGGDIAYGQKAGDFSLSYPKMMKKRFDSWHTLDGVRIEGLIMIDYEWDVFPVVSYDGENIVMTFDTGGKVFPDDDAPYWAFKPHRFTNVSEELDTRGEYFLDEGTMNLYVYGAEDGDVYSVTTGGQFISVGDGYKTGCEWLAFDGFTLRYAAETAVRVSHVSRHVSISNFDVYAVNGKGIHLNGDGNTAEGCRIEKFTEEGICCFGEDLTVRNNLIRGGDVGIYAAGVREISHNEISDTADSAIYYADCPTVIEYNVMRDCCLEGSDRGFVYNGASWFQVGGVIRYNCFVSSEDCGGFFVYLDDGLSNQEVYGNLFFGGASEGVRINGGRNNDVRDNVFVKRDGDGGGLLSLGAKYATMFDGDGNPTGSLATYHAGSLGQKPAPGTAEYDLWLEKWPEALRINDEWKNVETDPDCGANAAYNVVRDNYSFVGAKGNAHTVDEPYFTRFSTVENNPIFSLDENFFFENPTVGDYRVREGAGGGTATVPYIPFEEMGRY
ncbi:MAG: S-layer homology domain-containing protein [Clostridia bacterium]|nr:S-layer homology domain-containing protein [Clostridia bacterium]